MCDSKDLLAEAALSINDFILKYLSLQELELLAYETKFILRNSAILKAYDFLLMSLISSKGDSHNTLEDMVDTLEKYSKICITKQALAEKIDSSKAVDFLTACLRVVQKRKIDYILDRVSPELLSYFPKVLLQDSTTINLHEKLSRFFKGSGGRASKSALKIDLIYDLKSKEFVSFIITDMKTVDQTNSKEILEFVDVNTLVIRDLGYLQVNVLAHIDGKGAFFLSRMKNDFQVYLEIDDEQPTNLALLFEKEFATKDVVDLNVFITKKKHPVRLIVYRNPQEVTDKRCRVANETAKKQGKTVSKKHKVLSQYSMYITNVPKEVWEAEIVGTIYILRWQIELIFKCWKSVCQIHVLKCIKPLRIQVLILSRLIQLSIYTVIYGIIHRYSETVLRKEISMHKVFCWLKGEDEFSNILRLGLSQNEVKRIIKRSTKDQRKQRISSWENVQKQTSFSEIYSKKNVKSFLS